MNKYYFDGDPDVECSCNCSMIKHPNGEWYRVSEVDKEIERMKSENHSLQNTISRLTEEIVTLRNVIRRA